MGGDRDGNPNVTARVTKTVLLLARWIAADLFLRDISRLTAELSMQDASSELMALVGETDEPYRVLMKNYGHVCAKPVLNCSPPYLRALRSLRRFSYITKNC